MNPCFGNFVHIYLTCHFIWVCAPEMYSVLVPPDKICGAIVGLFLLNKMGYTAAVHTADYGHNYLTYDF